jgi:asparagine synthase (glutamine-hydrolysing)
VVTDGVPRNASRLVGDLLGAGGLEGAMPGLMYVDFKTWLPDNILTKIDRMSMAVSVEARVPFLDHRLVEFVAGLPNRLKVRNFGTKRLLRRTMRPILPARTLRRPKQAFRVPLDSWLAGDLRELLTDTLTSARARTRGLFDQNAVDRLLAEQRAGRSGSSRPLFTLLWLELWLRQVVDAPATAHV